jgi:hypothetical protein
MLRAFSFVGRFKDTCPVHRAHVRNVIAATQRLGHGTARVVVGAGTHNRDPVLTVNLYEFVLRRLGLFRLTFL